VKTPPKSKHPNVCLATLQTSDRSISNSISQNIESSTNANRPKFHYLGLPMLRTVRSRAELIVSVI